jgi:hypothetical protein
MNFKNTLFFFFLLLMSFNAVAQNPCGCPIDPNEPLVCAQDNSGLINPFPNECIANCLGFTLVADSLCFNSNPWADCNCVINPNEPEICVEFDGYNFQVPNACIADCKGFTIVADSLCSSNPLFDCMCEYDQDEPWICIQDSLGNICSAPNQCYADCWGWTVVECEEESIDWGTITCTADLIIGGNMLFQELLLALDNACDIELPECVLNAPIFASDSLFMDYILNNCNLTAPTNNGSTPVIGGLYNFYQSITSSTSDSDISINTSLSLKQNPVSNHLVYFVDSQIVGNAQVALLDINGRVMFSNNIQLSEIQQKFDADISSFQSGIYYLNLRTQEGQQTLRVVILK